MRRGNRGAGRGRNNGRLIGEKYLELLVCERAVCGIFLDIYRVVIIIRSNGLIDFFEHFETFVKKDTVIFYVCYNTYLIY